MLLAGLAGLVENPVRFAGGQALVAHVDGQAGEFTQRLGENPRLYCLAALRSFQMQRIPNHDARHLESASQPCQRAHVFARVAAAFQRKHRLRGESQLIRHSHADAAIADVQAKESGMEWIPQIFLSRLSLFSTFQRSISIHFFRLESKERVFVSALGWHFLYQ